MSFQPLGYRFEVKSSMSASSAIAAIRARKKGWFDADYGPRGWVFGSFICLWNSAFDRHGPMVFARIRADGLGTRIVGRAGADLNGTLMYLLLTPFMGWLTFEMAEHDQGSLRAFIVIGLVFGLGLPLTLWINHKDRAAADPIIASISRAVHSSNRESDR
jgi:hypothetical protein